MTTSSEPASRKSRTSSDPIAETARRHFTIPYLYPIQRYVISNILEQKNQVVLLPTGSGKSLCYQLPARIGCTPTVVVVPLLSLLADQLGRCREAGLRAASLMGGQSPEERAAILRRLQDGTVDLLFTTPETFGRIQPAIDTTIAHLVVDEAHCVAEWGESFRPAYLELGGILRKLRVRCLTAFTATASPRILERIKDIVFDGRDPAILSADPDRPNIRYSVIPTLSKTRTLVGLAATSPRPLLVFSRTRSGAERAARTLRRRLPDLDSRFYHAGLTREARRRVETWFKGSGCGILTATSAYGMGVDKPDIRTVIHLDVPYSPEAYLQETGRAGRDGSPVEATLLYSAEDLDFADSVAAADPSTEESPEFRTPSLLASERYNQMLGYATDASCCRRGRLLQFLAQEAVSCSGCDVCDGRVVDIPEGQRPILEAVSRYRRRFTVHQMVQLLRGAKSYRAVRAHLPIYGEFGRLADWQEEEIGEALVSLRRIGAIKVPKRGFWKHRVTTGEAFPFTPRN